MLRSPRRWVPPSRAVSTSVSADQVQAAAQKAGLDPATTAALVEDYSKAQLGSLKVGLLTAALLALIALMSTRSSRTIHRADAAKRGTRSCSGRRPDPGSAGIGSRAPMRRGPVRVGASHDARRGRVSGAIRLVAGVLSVR